MIWEHLNRAEAHECAELALLCQCGETALVTATTENGGEQLDTRAC